MNRPRAGHGYGVIASSRQLQAVKRGLSTGGLHRATHSPWTKQSKSKPNSPPASHFALISCIHKAVERASDFLFLVPANQFPTYWALKERDAVRIHRPKITPVMSSGRAFSGWYIDPVCGDGQDSGMGNHNKWPRSGLGSDSSQPAPPILFPTKHGVSVPAAGASLVVSTYWARPHLGASLQLGALPSWLKQSKTHLDAYW